MFTLKNTNKNSYLMIDFTPVDKVINTLIGQDDVCNSFYIEYLDLYINTYLLN